MEVYRGVTSVSMALYSIPTTFLRSLYCRLDVRGLMLKGRRCLMFQWSEKGRKEPREVKCDREVCKV